MISKGYDADTGQFSTQLRLDKVQKDDYGFYECLTESKSLLKSFQLYINGSKLLLPIAQFEDTFISVFDGQSVNIPCRLLNPTLDHITLNLINPSTGQEFPNVIRNPDNNGFRILEARLIQHSGGIECRAKSTIDGTEDSIIFTLSFKAGGNPDINPPDNSDQYFGKPVIEINHGYDYDENHKDDIHEGDDIALKCSLIIPKSYGQSVDLNWHSVIAGSERANLTINDSDSPGFIELVKIYKIPNIQTGGPFRCTATRNDDLGVVEAKSEEKNFNLVKFGWEGSAIEWHKDSFNDEIIVNEGESVKWVIGFTIHRKDHGKVYSPNYKFEKESGIQSRFINIIRNDDYGVNRFNLEMTLDEVDVMDMGPYKLEIENENGGYFSSIVSMILYVKSEPRVNFDNQSEDVFYTEGQDIEISCHILSYPIQDTR